MRKLILLAIIGFSCSKTSEQAKEVAEHIADTVYSTAFIYDPTYERLTVRMSDTSELNNINFRVGQKDFLKISAPRFEEYPIFIRNEVNVVIDERDSIKGIFTLTPTDTTFSIEVWQNYGLENVILKRQKTDTGFTWKYLNGYNQVGMRTFKIKESD